MSYNYGSRLYGQGYYGGTSEYRYLPNKSLSIEIYDNTGAKKGTYQLGCGYLLGCKFRHNKSGCVDFVIDFSKIVNIDKKDIIKIKLFNSLEYFFSGIVRKIPIKGNTENQFQYSGYGLNDYLIRLNAQSLSFANKTIYYILDYLLDNIITANTIISRNDIKLNPPDITLTSFEINYSNVNDVLKTLLDIASSEGIYYCGVDKDGDFFFLPESEETKKTLIVGAKGINGIDAYNPQDINEPRTKYFVLDKDGVYVTTVNTNEDNDIYEEKLVSPDIDNTSIENWAEGIMATNEQLIRNASINWKIEEIDPLCLVADGYLRIISNTPATDLIITQSNYGEGDYGAGPYGGEQYDAYKLDDTLRIMEVNYSIDTNGANREIQLGSLPVRLDEEFYSIKKDLTDLRISLGR